MEGCGFFSDGIGLGPFLTKRRHSSWPAYVRDGHTGRLRGMAHFRADLSQCGLGRQLNNHY